MTMNTQHTTFSTNIVDMLMFKAEEEEEEEEEDPPTTLSDVPL
jgi:hypothetical protein